MGWLFGRKKKKRVISSLQDDKSLSFGTNNSEGTILKPDQFKEAAGLDSTSIGMDNPNVMGMGDSPDALDTDVWGQLDSGTAPHDDMVDQESGPIPVQPLGTGLPTTPRVASRRSSQDYKYIQVLQYKRILGELKDLHSELSHMNSLGKSLEKAEYNEEKHFMRLKETMRKVHDKVLHSDRILFSS